MAETTWNDLEVAPRSAVMQSAENFAEALGETEQFQEFLKAHFAFRQDAEAQNAMQAFQEKQASLKALTALNAVSDAERQELQRLYDQFSNRPSVVQQIKAQEALIAMCQEVGDLISETVGLDYGSSCRTGGCCG